MKKFLARLVVIGAATVLLGAGCTAQQQANVETNSDATTQPAQQDDVDMTVDAYVKGSTDIQAVTNEESSDASVLTNTDAELNAYGQAYDKNAY